MSEMTGQVPWILCPPPINLSPFPQVTDGNSGSLVEPDPQDKRWKSHLIPLPHPHLELAALATAAHRRHVQGVGGGFTQASLTSELRTKGGEALAGKRDTGTNRTERGGALLRHQNPPSPQSPTFHSSLLIPYIPQFLLPFLAALPPSRNIHIRNTHTCAQGQTLKLVTAKISAKAKDQKGIHITGPSTEDSLTTFWYLKPGTTWPQNQPLKEPGRSSRTDAEQSEIH